MEKLIYRSFIGYQYYIYIDILQCGGEIIGPFGFNAVNTILIILKMPMDLQNKLIKLCSWDTLFPGGRAHYHYGPAKISGPYRPEIARPRNQPPQFVPIYGTISHRF